MIALDQPRRAVALPPAREEPLDVAGLCHELDGGRPWRRALGWAVAAFNYLVDAPARQTVPRGDWQGQAEALLDGRQVLHVVRTGTRVDCGAWDRRGRVWAFATTQELVLGAWGGLILGPRPWVRQIAYPELTAWSYSAATGSLLLKTTPTEDLPPLAMDATDGWQMLAQIETHREKGRTPC